LPVTAQAGDVSVREGGVGEGVPDRPAEGVVGADGDGGQVDDLPPAPLVKPALVREHPAG
ncbi:MAG TPA: hypothetical protein VIM84_14105, partial [Gemmatimonadales bacterium]